MHPRLPFLILALALTGCAPQRDEAARAPGGTPATRAAAPARPEAPGARQAAARISRAIRFTGFGPARFGADEEAVRQAWGRGLADGPRVEGSPCSHLYFSPEGEGDPPYPIAFMIEDGKFVRLEVKVAEYAAPGGGRVGLDADEIHRRYSGRLEEMPHKYVEGGNYLVASPKETGEARLIFETDATGKVTAWRIGLPPQVHYVEGCS